MESLVIRPYNVIDRTQLPEMSVNHTPLDGDALEIDGEMFYVCERAGSPQSDSSVIGVIPLVVKNPANIKNIQNYLECLSLAHRKVLFKNTRGTCDLENCDEMVIT
jgi:hypothetical protein